MVAVLPEIGIESSGTTRPITVRDRSNNELIALANLKTDTHRLELAETVDAGSSKIMGRGRTAVADAAYTVLTTDIYVGYTALTAPRVVTVPVPTSGFVAGQTLSIADESGACSPAKTITVIATGGTVPLAILSAPRQGVTLHWTGTTWSVAHSPSGVAFPIYDGGATRNAIDRSREIVNFLDMPGATTGAPADDNAALVAALSAAYAGDTNQRKPVVLPAGRVIATQSELVLAQGASLLGTGKDAIIRPSINTLRSVIRVTAARSVVRGLYIDTQLPYSSMAAISANKPHNNIECQFDNLEITGPFKTAILWEDGDRPVFKHLRVVNARRGIEINNNGVGGYFEDLQIQGGGGIYLAKNPAQAATGGSLGPQQAEGLTFIRCDLLSGRKVGVDGAACLPPLEIRAGLDLVFVGCTLGEVWTGSAILLVGSPAAPIEGVEFYGCDAIANLDNRDATGVVGVNVYGAVNNLLYMGGFITGCTDNGLLLNGDVSDVTNRPGFTTIKSVRFRNNGRANSVASCDVFASNHYNAKFEGNRFDSSANNNGTSVYEAGDSQVVGDGNWFRYGLVLSGKSNWGRSLGPGAPLGMPSYASDSAAVAAGLTPGMHYRNTSTTPASLRVVGL